MGIDAACAQALFESLPYGHGKTSVLMLGRQSFVIRPKYFSILNTVLEDQGYDFCIEDTVQKDGYCETLFHKLGFETIESLDVNDYENATHITDLGEALPKDVAKSLKARFDFVFDGGTTEHIFNVGTCFNNVNHILGPNGAFLSVVPLNGWAEHGFFQFGPEIVYGFWQNAFGYSVSKCMAVSFSKPWKRVELKDHTSLSNRPRLGQGTLPDGRCYLVYLVEKKSLVEGVTNTMQSFYEKTWTKVKDRKPRKKDDLAA